MKKIIFSILIGLLFCSSMFSGIFNSRFFEVKFNGAFDVGNNIFTLDELLQENVVIDMKDVAERIPDSGLNLKTSMMPNLEVNLNLSKLHVGIDVGFDIYGSMTITKSFFDLIGVGYTSGNTVDFAIDTSAEVYASVGVGVGYSGKKYKLSITPSVFVPVFVVMTDDVGVELNNRKNGSVKGKVKGKANVYSQFAKTDSDDSLIGFDFGKLNGDVDIFNVSQDLEYAFSVAGFDLSGNAEVPLLLGLKGGISFRCPIVPGRLNTKTTFSVKGDIDSPVMDLVGNKDLIDNFGYEIETKYEEYKTNRPLKLNGYLKFQPLGEWLYVMGGLGMGIRSPFTAYYSFYPEYIVEGYASVLSGLLSAKVSTEYTNQIFIHKLGMSLGLRATQFDIGLSAESPTLTKSFNFSGLGLYVGTAIGF